MFPAEEALNSALIIGHQRGLSSAFEFSSWYIKKGRRELSKAKDWVIPATLSEASQFFFLSSHVT